MTVLVVLIHIIIVVLPILRASIVRRVNVDAIHLPRIRILQKLQRMIIVRLNHRMPEVALRRVLHLIERLQIWINRRPELRRGRQLAHGNRLLLLAAILLAQRHLPIHALHRPEIACVILPCDKGVFLHRHVIQQRTFRQVTLEHEAERLVVLQLFRLRTQARAEHRVTHLRNQIVNGCHGVSAPHSSIKSTCLIIKIYCSIIA